MPRSGCAAAVLDGYVYVAGGCTADGLDSSSVERLGLQSLAWETQPGMRLGRDEFPIATAEGCMYALGGSHLVWPKRQVTDSLEKFRPGDDAVWEVLPPLRHGRCASAAASLGGFVYALGGCNAEGKALDFAERFSITQSVWEPLPAMQKPRCNFAAAVAAGSLYAVGGYDDNMQDICTIERLHPSSTQWSVVSLLAVPRWGLRAVGCAGCIFIVGGHSSSGEVCRVERWNPSTGEWLDLPPLRSARRSFGLAVSSKWGCQA